VNGYMEKINMDSQILLLKNLLKMEKKLVKKQIIKRNLQHYSEPIMYLNIDYIMISN